MRFLLSILAGLLCCHALLYGQENIAIDTDQFTVEELVRDVLIQSGCASVSNITFSGRSAQIGYFHKGDDAIKVSDGIILSTGRVEDAVGPNERTGTATVFTGTNVGDEDLRRVANALSTNEVIDKAILEFDFVPLEDYIEFEFVFASEEYCDFAGPHSPYNDVFGFFLSGPGISGPFVNNAKNIASNPSNGGNISVLNINHNVNYDYFIDNTPQNQPLGRPEHYLNCRLDVPRDGINSLLEEDGKSLLSLEYDGYTVKLVARSDVIPNERYHLKIGIADIVDGSWDSAVFLKAGSFRAGQPQATIEEPLSLTCLRPTIELDGSGSTTGTGLTHEWLTTDGNIVSGENGLHPVVDRIGTYTLVVHRSGSRCSDSASVEVIFEEGDPIINGAESDVLTCAAGVIDIRFDVTNPTDYTYRVEYPSGSFSAISAVPTIPSTHPGWHTLYAFSSNGCQHSIEHFVQIDSFTGRVQFANEVITCQEPELMISPQFEDDGNPFAFSWTTIGGNIISESDQLNIRVDEPGSYYMEVLNLQNGCSESFIVIIAEDKDLPVISAGPDDLIPCMDDKITLAGSIENRTGLEHVTWESIEGIDLLNGLDELSPIATAPGLYVLHVTGENGCHDSDTVQVSNDENATIITLLKAETLTCEKNQAAIDITVDSPIEEISWTTEDGDIEIVSANSQSVLVNTAGTYYVEVVNDRGCISSAYIEVVQIEPPIADAGMDVLLDCFGQASIQALQVDDNLTYSWSQLEDPTFQHSGAWSTVEAAGTYQLNVYDPLSGCTSTDDVQIIDRITAVDYILNYSACSFDNGTFEISEEHVDLVNFVVYNGNDYQATDVIAVHELADVRIVLNSGCDQNVSLDYLSGEALSLAFEQVEPVVGEPFDLSININRLQRDISTVQWTADVDIPCSNCLNQKLTLFESTTVSVEVEDVFGCVESASIDLNPKSLVKTFVPTAFSPNNDGINDFMNIFYNDHVVGIESIRIFDRWGGLVFTRHNDAELTLDERTFFWDGTYQGKLGPQGLYVYEITVRSTAGQSIISTGQVALIR